MVNRIESSGDEERDLPELMEIPQATLETVFRSPRVQRAVADELADVLVSDPEAKNLPTPVLHQRITRWLRSALDKVLMKGPPQEHAA